MLQVKKLHSNTLRENQEKRAFRVGPTEPGKDIQKSPDQSFLKRPCKKDTSGVESLEIRAMFYVIYFIVCFYASNCMDLG